MSILIEEIADLITSESSIYIGEMPSTPYNTIVITPTGGRNPVYSLGQQLPSITYPTIQIMVRDVSYANSYTRVEAIKTALSGKVTDNFVIYQQSDLLQLGKNEFGHSLFSINFLVMVT